jgi:hypothetical protein
MREVLQAFLSDVDGDPEVGPRLRSTQVPQRFAFPDLGLVCNIADSEDAGHCIRWSFSDDVEWKPALTLEMDSAVANRFLQGHENLAIAIARGRIHCSTKTRAALSFLPISGALIERYRRIVERQYPHLVID